MFRLVKNVRSTLLATAFSAALMALPAFGVAWIELKITVQFIPVKPDVLGAEAIVLVGAIMDCARARRLKRYAIELDACKLTAHRTTMRTVQHLVNTFLNDLVLFAVGISGLLPRRELNALDDQIQRIARQLKALGDLQSITERPLGGSIGIEYDEADKVPAQDSRNQGRIGLRVPELAGIGRPSSAA